MAQQVTAAHRVTYRENMRLKLQQTTSKLLASVTDIVVSGAMAQLEDVFGEVAPNYLTTRHGDTLYNDTPHDRRWIAQPPAATYVELADTHDKLASGIDLTGGYVRVGAATLNRAVDDAIVGGIFGTAQTGEKGTVLTPFDASNVVPVNTGGAASGLNVAKLLAAREILLGNFVDLDEDELWIGISSRQGSNLLGEVQVTSRDFAAYGAELREGKLGRLLGFNFAHLELGNPMLSNNGLTVDGSGYRKVPFWAKSGVIAAFWERMFTNVEQLATKNYSTQVYARRQVAATRTDEGKVGYILCNEAA